jgi:hypothetical protein
MYFVYVSTIVLQKLEKKRWFEKEAKRHFHLFLLIFLKPIKGS